MENQEYILIDRFCEYHGLEISIIEKFQAVGLLEIVQIDDNNYIPMSQLGETEKIIRLYNDLEINAEGIHAVLQLLVKINNLQEELSYLKNKLYFYEGESDETTV